MQTKQQIQQLLASAGASVNKRLGQHFLIDLNLMRLLVDSANIGSDDIVLEVGCGTGSLTEAMAEKAGKVVAVELDGLIAAIAERQLARKENVVVLNTDILESKNILSSAVTDAITSARKDFSGRLLLVANLPYNAACPVMLNLVKGPMVAEGMYVTVQKEVADRMTSLPGNKHYGTLSIFLAAVGDVKRIRVLRPSVFWPAPKVDSAMVSFVRRDEKVKRIKDVQLFSYVVAFFMQHRRKMLKSAVKFAKGSLLQIENWQEVFEKCCIDPQNRPEQIQPEEFLAIANLCGEYLNAGN